MALRLLFTTKRLCRVGVWLKDAGRGSQNRRHRRDWKGKILRLLKNYQRLGTNSATTLATSSIQQLISFCTVAQEHLFPREHCKKGIQFYEKPQENRLSADVRLFHSRHRHFCTGPNRKMWVSNIEFPAASR
jgi:hypothetical protein